MDTKIYVNIFIEELVYLNSRCSLRVDLEVTAQTHNNILIWWLWMRITIEIPYCKTKLSTCHEYMFYEYYLTRNMLQLLVSTLTLNFKWAPRLLQVTRCLDMMIIRGIHFGIPSCAILLYSGYAHVRSPYPYLRICTLFIFVSRICKTVADVTLTLELAERLLYAAFSLDMVIIWAVFFFARHNYEPDAKCLPIHRHKHKNRRSGEQYMTFRLYHCGRMQLLNSWTYIKYVVLANQHTL